ncbi:MAG: transposase [Pseudomonadota bacterium]
MNKKPHSRRLRDGRHSEVGRIYHIRLVCWHRRPVFADFEKGRAVVRAMQQVESVARTLAFVVMPDHVHWLMSLEKGAALGAVVQKLKSLTTRELHGRWEWQGPVWQSGFYDRAIRRDDDLLTIARYIVANPLRAGLVRSIRDYSLWDAVWL